MGFVGLNIQFKPWASYYLDDAVRCVGDVVGMGIFQFLDRTEAPCDTT